MSPSRQSSENSLWLSCQRILVYGKLVTNFRICREFGTRNPWAGKQRR